LAQGAKGIFCCTFVAPFVFSIQTMKAAVLVLACLACSANGGRVRRPDVSMDRRELINSLAGLLVEPNLASAFNPSGNPTGTGHPRAVSAALDRSVPVMNLDVPVPADVEANPIFVDEKAKLAEASFKIPPDQLILLAKRFLVSSGGFGGDPDLIAEDFKFMGPVVGPLSKTEFLTALSGVDVPGAFPDWNPEFHGFQVDPLEGDRVWYIARGRGTHTGPFPPFAPEPTNKKVVNPPQACSLTFNEKGLVTKYTIGYVMDRAVGTTGGLGGLYGLAHAIGKTLPFPEAQPWKKSKRYALFQWLARLAQSRSKN